MAEIQFGKVFPVHPPGPGYLDFPLGAPDQPLGVGFVKTGGPAGVVDGDVDKYPGVALVNGIHQLDKLFQRGGMMIKFGQGRIHRGEAQGRIGTAESSHTSEGGGGGMNRQQHQIAATQLAQNKIKFSD